MIELVVKDSLNTRDITNKSFPVQSLEQNDKF